MRWILEKDTRKISWITTENINLFKYISILKKNLTARKTCLILDFQAGDCEPPPLTKLYILMKSSESNTYFLSGGNAGPRSRRPS